MTSPLKQILEYPPLKREFDLTCDRYPATRKWLGKLLKVIMPNRSDGFNKTDIKVLKWTLIRLRKKEFETEGELFAAGNAIFIELYSEELMLLEKKEKDRRESMVQIGGFI
jgi:hypothetical protein